MEIALEADGKSGFPPRTDQLTINCEAPFKAIGVAASPDRPRRESPKLRDPLGAEAEPMGFRYRYCSAHQDRQRHEALHDPKIPGPKNQPKKHH